MIRSKKQVSWKKDRLFSIELRNKHFALIQMLEEDGQVAVFNCFKDFDDWVDLDLTAHDVLFIGTLLDIILIRSKISIHTELKPVAGLKYPEFAIHPGNDFKKIKVWEGTEYERELEMMNFNLCLRRTYIVANQTKIEYEPIEPGEFERYEGIEMANLNGYPNFNERLLLCEMFGRNVDPLRDIVFGRPLPLEYRTYIDIIAGKTLLSELGY